MPLLYTELTEIFDKKRDALWFEKLENIIATINFHITPFFVADL